MVKIEKLSSGYDDLQVIKDVSLGLEVGTISVLMGPNGAGKSTLLKSIFNLTNVTSGKIFFEGENITGLPAHKLLSKGVAFVSQGRVNFGNLSVQDNLHMGLHFEKNKNMIDVKMNEIYKQFPVLKEKENQPAFSLSGGVIGETSWIRFRLCFFARAMKFSCAASSNGRSGIIRP